MTPDYTSRDGRIKLYNADCMDYMATLEDNAFELAVVDPPYGINAGKMTMGSGKHKFSKGKDWDSSIPCADYFSLLRRSSANRIIWGGNYFTEHLPPTAHWLLWDKNNPNLSFAEGELAWMETGKNLRIFKHYSASEGVNKIHPTQKPIRLYAWQFERFAKEGDRILDTHLGSGSSAIAAHYAGLEFVGIELDEDYFDAAVKRFEQETAQSDMFGKGDE